jgi:2-keto-3-deoxy-L-rhamnonate aldolase RhmA
MPFELTEILRNNVKEKLALGEVVASMTVRLVRGIEIVRLAKTAGFDSIYVDLEHSDFSLDTAGQICMAALEAGIACFVRVPRNTPDWIARALDAGALGVIAPHVGSAAEARAVVQAAKFSPIGARSLSGQLPHLQFRRFPAVDARHSLNEATMVIVQLESLDAIEHAEEIVAVDGVDMVLVGANDLTADLGIPGQFEHESLRQAFARTIAACRAHNKHAGVGGLARHPKLAAEFVKMGARYVSTGTDLGFLLGAASERARQVRELAS